MAFVAWVLAKAPDRKILQISGNRDLRKDLDAACRGLLLNHKMRALFTHLRLLNTPKNIALAQGGLRRAAMTYESLTGTGADMIILDDPMDAGKADDPKEIIRLAKWVQSTVVQRLNRTDDPIILVTQRLHAHDLTRHLLESGDKWTLLSIPAIATRDEKWVLSDGREIRRKQRETLHPARQSSDNLLEIAQTVGAKNFRAQYQQTPIDPVKDQIRAAVFLMGNGQTNEPCGFYRVSEMDRLLPEVFGVSDDWYNPYKYQHPSPEEWEACAAPLQAELAASMRADFLESE